MKAGRPTKYTNEMPEKFMSARKEGKTVEQIARDFDIDDDTFREWARVHPEFSAAFKKGKKLALAAWQDKLEAMMYDKEVNSGLVKLYFTNCFGWSDKQEIKSENKTHIDMSVEIKEVEEIRKSFERDV